MKEIGGYLELDDFVHHEYYPKLRALNTARNALIYLCRARKIKKIWLPYFLCDFVSNACKSEGSSFSYYHINEDFSPDFKECLGHDEYLYIVNYYGQLRDEEILSYQQQWNNIILDNVQAFFTKPMPDIDTIYCCRKFFGVPDGAYLSTNAPAIDLPADVSKDRMKHLLGRYEGKASDYYADFKKNDMSFENLPLRRMSKLTHNLLGAIDYEKVQCRREENWQILDGALHSVNKLHPTMPAGPYMYPFYCKDGMKLKKALAEKHIFIPTFWPNVLEFENCPLEKDLAENILPLPVDQRYGKKDMQIMVEKIRELQIKL